MENNYKVYCHLFPNGKRYIGITKQRLAIRFKNGYGYQRSPIMWKAIQKYKWENIEHNVLFENLTKEEAETKEIELIAKYKSNDRKFGYNIANGGNCIGTVSEETKKKIGKPVKCVETGMIYYCAREAERQTGISYKSISDSCRKNKTIYGLHWEFVKNRRINSE